MNEHDEQPGEGWTMGARDDYTRKALEAVEAGSTDTAVVYMMIGLSKTLQSLEHQITAINLREGRNDYPPEAEPYFDKAQQFAQAGELEKALVYGVLNVGALLDGFFPRMDEMIHALRSRR
ncbi:hypothetical protein SAMN05421678_117131 [Actinopolymorpha cephalotaxi]|nr:hypothetical protein SAMN05421678_117131 [Actinopolymorpha cephalotaxi]